MSTATYLFTLSCPLYLLLFISLHDHITLPSLIYTLLKLDLYFHVAYFGAWRNRTGYPLVWNGMGTGMGIMIATATN